MLTRIDPDAESDWDEFVAGHAAGTVYHHSAWLRVLRQSFSCTPFCVADRGRAGGPIRGLVPCMLARRYLGGRKLVSLPLTSYCPPLAGHRALEELVEFVLREDPRITSIEIKLLGRRGKDAGPVPPYETQAAYVTHILALNKSESALLASFHGSSVRHRIRRSARENLRFRLGESEEDLRAFYRLLTRVRRKHGLPPHPYRFFRNMWRILDPLGMLILPIVEHQGKVVSAGLVPHHKAIYHLEYSATDERFFSSCANQMLLWETIKIALAQGATNFDFGRSGLTQGSLIAFKERWAAKPRQLPYLHYPRVPRGPGRRRTLRRLGEALNRRMPAWLLRLEGQLLYHHPG